MHEIIYLTGAPASGKSSLTRALKSRFSQLEVFEYGERLTAHLNGKGNEHKQTDIRNLSSSVVTPDDVAAVDKQLVEFVDEKRAFAPVIIDSHAVTKERYGYRVTPYSLKDFEKLNPTQIWVLYISPEATIERIGRHAQGRPQLTEEEARFHTHLQSGVATTYGMHLGIPVYLFDSSVTLSVLADDLAKRLKMV